MYDFAELRKAMVAEQLVRRGITDPAVLAAMGRVPRERFVPEELAASAYEDRALAIDCGQTISQPYIVALMTQALQLRGTERVLEIGAGSGYQTAVLAELAGEVVAIERHEELASQAVARLAELGYRNVLLQVGDGSQGCLEYAPYGGILVAAAASAVPDDLLAQLAPAGTLVIPVGDRDGQSLLAVRKENGRVVTTTLSGCRFVPLIGDFEPE